MKIENWIVTLGIVFVLLVSILAFLPEDFPEADLPNPAVNGIMNPAPGALLNNAPEFNVPFSMEPMTMGQPRSIVAAAIKPGQRAPGQKDFERARTVRFSGTVQQVSEIQQHDGQIHIWIHDARGREQLISVGPIWFLKYIGCSINHDIPISGVGFRFDKFGDDPMIYAKKIMVNGKKCRLRNDEGFALWSNRLR